MWSEGSKFTCNSSVDDESWGMEASSGNDCYYDTVASAILGLSHGWRSSVVGLVTASLCSGSAGSCFGSSISGSSKVWLMLLVWWPKDCMLKLSSPCR